MDFEMEITTDKPLVMLCSFPRSGNTFVRQVLFEAYGLKTFTLYQNEWATERFGGWVNDTDFSDVPVGIIKSHNMIDGWDGLVWHVVRDGRDAITSFRHWKQDTKSGAGNEWARRVQAFESVADHTTKYEDLIANPIGTVQAGIDALGLTDHIRRTGGTLTPFSELQASNGKMWREGHTGGWVCQMPDVVEFMANNKQAMQELKYA